MQRLALSWYGPTIAPVGQAVMQRVHVPQCSVSGRSSGSGRSVYSSPRKKYEPASRLISTVCLPTQPRPALRASAFSITGAESTKAR